MAAMLEAILFEDDKVDARFYKPIWERILKHVWPEVRLQVQEGFDDTSIFETLRPHVVIVDNVLQAEEGSDSDNRGLQLISELKPDHEDTLFILFTRESFTIESLGYRTPNPDIIVTKTPLPNSDYELNIARQVEVRLNRLPIRPIDFDLPSDFTEEEISFLEVQTLVEQSLYSLQSFRKEFGREFDAIEKVKLSRLGGGRSGAGVFKCNIFRSRDSNNSQFVFKWTDWKSIGREIDNYHRYVRLQIPHHVRVDLVGVGRVGEFGAALYGFAFGASEIVSSLTKPLQDGSVTELFAFVENVVLRDAIGWYQFNGDTVDIESHFNDGEEYSPGKDSRRLAGLRSNLLRFYGDSDCKVSDRGVEFQDVSFNHIRNYLRNARGENLPRYICHGDLNSNNVMVFLGGPQFSLIDFEYTGPDIVYKDFVSLELSLRLYYPSKPEPEEFTSWLAAEEDIIEALDTGVEKDFHYLNGDTRGLFLSVLKLRKLAKEFVESRDISFSAIQYEYALSFHLYKVAALDDWKHWEFPRLLFSYLASLNAFHSR